MCTGGGAPTFLLRFRLRLQRKNPINNPAAITPAATPTPIPAFAPVDSPLDSGSLAAAVFEVSGDDGDEIALESVGSATNPPPVLDVCAGTLLGVPAAALLNIAASVLCHQMGIPSPLTSAVSGATFVMGTPVSQPNPAGVGRRNVTLCPSVMVEAHWWPELWDE